LSVDPIRCHIAGCPGRVLYKIDTRGYCASHKPGGNWRDEVAVIARVVRNDVDEIWLEPVVSPEPSE